MKIHFFENDLPHDITFTESIAIDTETLGLSLQRDRLCLVQISDKDGNCYLIHFKEQNYNAPNLTKILQDPNILKIFHFARFDIAMLYKHLGVMTHPIVCTKIASKLVRTYSDKHGLAALCRELLQVDLSKAQQSSYWGADTLTEDQKRYAAHDVIYLHKIYQKLFNMLEREKRLDLAQKCFDFLPTRVLLDIKGFDREDFFSH